LRDDGVFIREKLWLENSLSQTFSRINTTSSLKPSHSSHLPACDGGTHRVFRNIRIQNSDAGELPRRKHTAFRTWRKFEIEKKLLNYDS